MSYNFDAEQCKFPHGVERPSPVLREEESPLEVSVERIQHTWQS